MPKFNLEEYEPVEDRLRRFHLDYKEGRVITEMVEYTEDRVVIKASLYRNFEENKPWSTGYAEETRGQGGMVNTTSHVENCETSAIGRALANAGYAPKGKRPSREEMVKVRRQYAEMATKKEASLDKDTEENLKQIRRLYALTAKLNPNSQNIGQKVTEMVVKVGYKSLNDMPKEKIKALADKLESIETNPA